MFLKNRNISSKIKRSKVTDYAALRFSLFYNVRNKPENSICPTGTMKTKQLVPHNFNLPCHMIHLTYLRILIGSKYENAKASNENSDQTAPLGAV